VSQGRRPTGWLRVVVVVVGVHSVLLGLAVLLFPRTFTEQLGFPGLDSIFFPTQAGAFLVALGVIYLLALRDRAFVWAIVVSKSVAVLFLFTHALFLDAPGSVLAAGLGDLLLLAATLAAIRSSNTIRRASSPRTTDS
jgi:hypothetical protein